jgi:predicted membrane protein
MDFCQPAKVYLVIALFTLMYYVYNDQDYIWVVLKAALFIFWGFVIDRICLQDMKAIAWIMAIIPPFIFLFFTLQVPPAIPNAPQTTNQE